MDRPGLAIRLLDYADTHGIREELIGDLLEEIARGRSRLWLCQQLLGLYGLAFATRVRNRARLTPHTVALAICALLLGGVSIASVSVVLQAWLAFYLGMGTLSLFGHMAARAIGSGGTVVPVPADAPKGE